MLVFAVCIETFSQSYSIDHPKIERKKIHLRINFRKIFIGDKVARQQRKDARKESRKQRKEEKQYQKSIKKYQKTLNKPDYIHTNKDAYKNMKKTKRAQDRQAKGKHRDPWIKRLFYPEREREKKKLSKEDRQRIRDPFFKRIFKGTPKRKRRNRK
ncbi:MAG: hypothetical protein Kow0068_25790 [Marinilabiliales bacterium]